MGLPSPISATSAAARSIRRTPAWRTATAAIDVVGGPVRRTARFCAGTWFDWADWRRARGPFPVPRPTVALAAEVALDEAVLSLFRVSHRPRPPEAMARILDEAAAAAELYERRGWLSDPASYFATPTPLADPDTSRHRLGSLGYERVRFPSDYEPHPGEPGRERWLGYRANRTAHAWLLRHRDPRPWLVCIHGAGMGNAFMDLTGFRAAWLHHGLGLNLAFPVMPLHGPRRDGMPFGVGFPNDDLLDTVHGVAQAVWDTRRLIGWIRSQEQGQVGLSGLSLGGYTTAVVASLEEGLACVIAGVPAVDFADLLGRHAPPRFLRRADYRALSGMSRQVHRVISPLGLAPLVPRQRRFIYAGLADRLVPARRQVRALWDHWDQPRISWFDGGHIGFLWSAAVWAFIEEALGESGLVEAPPGRRPPRSALR